MSVTRKTVTVLFCDITDSTPLGERLDPEALRHVMGRYFEEMRAVVERHGGVVEKFIGDAVMAVFGIPQLHEDDALRAVRAATEMREALASLNDELRQERGIELGVRTGIDTGEVVAGDGTGGQALVTGPAVVLAQRLESAAKPGEILIGETTHRLVREAGVVEPLPPLEVKGRSEQVAAFRLLAVVAGVGPFPRRFGAQLVGRKQELAALERTFEHVVEERRCRLVTVIGTPGVGKSRLAAELVSTLEGTARAIVGRCLPYGDGITYWPLTEAVKQAADITLVLSPGEASARVAALVDSEDDGRRIAELVAGAIGLAEAEGSNEEVSWAFRRLLEALARLKPLVVLFEDVHWAEPTFLDLVEHVAEHAREPILLLCLARPELLEGRPNWGGDESIALEPLEQEEGARLVENLLGQSEVARRIAEAGEGNPLFLEETVAMLVDEGALRRQNGGWIADQLGTIVVPPTIQALLAARLDRLSAGESAAIERAAVIGAVFHLSALQELSGDSELRTHLAALTAKQLLQRAPSSFGDDEAFRFRHILIREAAYQRLPKATRADLHERYAAWLRRAVGERTVEFEEIIGYHLEQAFRHREQLGPVTERDHDLASQAGDLLGAAGRRAFGRDDMPAAINLLDRAVALLSDQHPVRLELIRELSSAFWAVGELARAETLLDGLLEAASAAGDRRIEWYALLERAGRRSMTDPDATEEDLSEVAQEAIRVFEELGDDLGLARAWRRLSWAPRDRGRFATSQDAIERSLRHARRAKSGQEEARSADSLCTVLLLGPAPATEAIRRCEELAEQAVGNPLMEASVFISLGGLKAMQGEFDDARELSGRSGAIYEELGLRLPLIGWTEVAGWIELVAGDAPAAEALFRRGYELLPEAAHTAFGAFQAGLLAEALLARGREDEAERLARESEAGAATDDIAAQLRWRMIRAELDARTNEAEGAVAVASEAVELAAGTDALNMHADALLALAEAFRAAGRDDDAAASIRHAIDLYGQKQNLVGADRARLQLAIPAS
jgi:class 3 adenylate cyclase/tetratricopeptide (TPR) repeat protein